jgi:hypothetical protein
MQDDSVTASSQPADDDLRTVIRQVLREHAHAEQERLEPAYKAELLEERRRREQLERKVNELAEENQRSRAMAEETDRFAAIRTELQRQGVVKLDLAFKAIKDDVTRSSEGRLIARSADGDGDVALGDYVTHFVQQNPELLPARISGGSGATSAARSAVHHSNPPLDLDRIRPGMDPNDLARVREEISRAAQQAMSGR